MERTLQIKRCSHVRVLGVAVRPVVGHLHHRSKASLGNTKTPSSKVK